ncbi:MAG: lipopolysaccharide ABC transporter ATP-binding protein, partial [SAR324 cluster bacterium]|nr:lipopolysaccharide ABC transporter ATP-binding protein [SAR324 cluster bacterium]
MSIRKLEASHLKKSYNGRHVVKGISLEVKQGQVVG